MSIENMIQGNTNALLSLTEAIIKLERLLADINTKEEAQEPVFVTAGVDVSKELAFHNVRIKKLDYAEVKGLINKLAMEHREAIKELNKKYKLGVFADILVDKDDPAKGVVDEEKLVSYHAELLSLEQGK